MIAIVLVMRGWGTGKETWGRDTLSRNPSDFQQVLLTALLVSLTAVEQQSEPPENQVDCPLVIASFL